MTPSGAIRRLTRRPRREGERGVEEYGHREYVGGLWDEVGQLQFDFMVGVGLEARHVLCDVACGSLRGGVWFIPYLDPGSYLGLEREAELVKRGVEVELTPAILVEKRPEFVISDCFEFERFSRPPDYAIAQSLFSHLTIEDIEICLRKLRAFSSPRFFATFFEADAPVRNATRSHAHRGFRYTRDQLAEAGERTAWSTRYIGDWNHPRGQHMIEFKPA